MCTTATIFHNIATDPQGRPAGMLDGYRAGHPLVPVARITRAATDDAALLNTAYHVCNVGDDPSYGTPDADAVTYRARRNRSLSIGDVVKVGNAWYAVARFGWDVIEAPQWLAVGAHAFGTASLDD